MVRHIAALSLTNSNGRAVKSLSAWFSQNRRTNLNRWKEDHPVETVNENEVDLVLREHEAWCKQVNIQATPTIFVNGKKLPPEYTVGDLKYHVRYLIEQIS
jgi:protein-disulfide isomerase